MAKYRVVIEFETDVEIVEAVMEELVSVCAVQLESLNDGSLESAPDADIDYKVLASKWKKVE